MDCCCLLGSRLYDLSQLRNLGKLHNYTRFGVSGNSVFYIQSTINAFTRNDQSLRSTVCYIYHLIVICAITTVLAVIITAPIALVGSARITTTIEGIKGGKNGPFS